MSPVHEHVIVTTDAMRPWWERYQPVSYKLTSRSGTEEEFISMVQRCNAVGVRIYVDAVLNHMAGLGRSGIGSAGSSFDSDAHDFPGVPFTVEDFTPRDMCPSHDGMVTLFDLLCTRRMIRDKHSRRGQDDKVIFIHREREQLRRSKQRAELLLGGPD